MKGNKMFIILAISSVTGIETFFIGQVLQRPDSKYAIEPAWGIERRFATQFATEELADKIADAFRHQTTTVMFSVVYERY